MSQLWQINGQWLTLEQMKAWRKREDEKLRTVEKKEEIIVPEVIEEKVADTPTVSDVLSVDGKLPEIKENGFVESELAELTVLDLREIAKQNNIRIKGQPSRLEIINILMKK